MSDRRWALILLCLGALPLLVLLVFLIVPSLVRADFNPLVQVATLIVVIGFTAAGILTRRILSQRDGALVEKVNGGVRVSLRFVLLLLAAICAIIGITWTVITAFQG